MYINHQNTALLVLSVNNRYTGLVRADISYGKIMGRKIFQQRVDTF